MQRIVVVGVTGAGKTTLARQLAARLELEHIELDALHWEADWQEASLEDFRVRVTAATQGDRWVSDGNYSVVRDIIWPKAELVVWLDYPLRTIYWRLFKRTSKRVITRELLWGKNRERLWNQFTGDSLFWWATKTYQRRKRQYPQDLQKYGHLASVRLRSPGETRRWLATVSHSATTSKV